MKFQSVLVTYPTSKGPRTAWVSLTPLPDGPRASAWPIRCGLWINAARNPCPGERYIVHESRDTYCSPY